MKNFIKSFIALTLSILFIMDPLSAKAADIRAIEQQKEAVIDSLTMTEKQLSAISMLNYLTVFSQEINASSNSKLYLDNAYSSIVNNINPNAVDSDSKEQIDSLLNTIEAYQSIATKRERLQYIYQQNQAKAIQNALPNPMSVLNVVQSTNPAKALVSVVYMAVDSKSSYDSYVSEVEDKYMQDGWVLDDEAAENLHESRKEAFNYMVEMCQKNSIDGKLALNENAVSEFVKWENNENTTRRVDFLEKNKKTYAAYGKYWLVLAETYYDLGENKKCLSALETYENMNIVTFRKDHDFAKALTIGLAAASDELKSDEEYVDLAEHYLTLILANIETTDWMLRYLCAESYLDLYAKSGNKLFLRKAYSLAEENVNYLIDEQYAKNNAYLEDVQKLEPKKGDSDKRKKEIKNYNKWLEEERKTELPPVYEPLVTNCELLFGIAEKLNISDTEKNKIDKMLHGGDTLFLTFQLENKYKFNSNDNEETPLINFDGKELTVPASLLAQGSSIKMTITSDGKNEKYEDWILDEVDREKEHEVEKFNVIYKSKSVKKYEFMNGDKLKIEIVPGQGSTYGNLVYNFKAKVKKKFKVINDTTFILEK